jgi:serine/threonine protein kinase
MKLCPLCKRTWEDEFRVCPIDGLALQTAAVESDPYTGQTVGRARIGQKIADGEQGPVYRADEPVIGAIAIQFINAERLNSPVLMEAFEDAVKRAAGLNHPNVVRVYSMERTPDGSAAVLMEYVGGTNLEAHRKDHPTLDIQKALGIVKEAAQGILAAHRMSLLHGSLHPSRVLIASDGTAKVGGFHRSVLRDDLFPSTSAPSGLAYLAPERAGTLRDIPVPDYRADVYSLGAILYELLAGRLPYEAKSIEDMGAAMAAGPPLPPSFSNPQVSPTLSRVVLKAISQHPGDRHTSVEAFIRELEAARRPIREPERESAGARYPSPVYSGAGEDSGLFSPLPAPSGKKPAGNPWPESDRVKDSGEKSFFDWFKTRAGGRAGERKRARLDDSFAPRKGTSRIDDDSVERTVVVSSKRGARRRRSLVDTISSFGRDKDLTGTDLLPRRRFSSRAYLLMGVGGVVLITGLVVLFLIFGPTATGKLSIDSNPSGARVFLNSELRGNTPLVIPEIRADVYRLRLEMEGYETVSADIEVGPKADIQRAFALNKETPLLGDLSLPPITPPPNPPATPDGSGANPTPFEARFNEAIRSRSFFPPALGNAWEILQAWRQREAAAPTATLEQSQQIFCRELERLGAEKLDQRDFQYVRSLLEQVRNRMPGQVCAGGLQGRFDEAISRSLSELRNSLNAAMSRQNYVTPDSDNALKYARLILHIDPQDAEAKSLDNDIYARALDQARAKSEARDHQEALNIYLQLKNNYSNPKEGGSEAISQAVERERQKLSILSRLKVPVEVPVKHGHSFFQIPKLGKRDCTGKLRADGFNIDFQSTGDHSLKVPYDQLKSVLFNNGKFVLESSAQGKVELEQADKNPSPSLAEVYAKIQEYRKLREQYFNPKP